MDYLAHVKTECQELEALLTRALEAAGLTVYKGFSLREALKILPACPCRCHGTDECTCTYTVLLVYDGSSSPALVVVHGRNGLMELRISGGGLTGSSRERILDTLATALGDGVRSAA